MPSIINATTSTGLVSSADNSGSLQLATNNGTTAVTINTSQNVGIGTTSPDSKLHVKSTVDNTTNGLTLEYDLGTAYKSRVFTRGNNLNISADTGNTGGGILFLTAGGTERASITSGGTVLLGTTSTSTFDGGFRANPTGTGGSMQVALSTTGGGTPFLLNTTADTNIINFYRSSTNVGTISVTTSATAYNTSSDYRLKENIAPMTGALAKVAQLKPVTYTWKSTGETSQGFIAHELQAVVPDCVTGEKDAVDEEGNPVHQGVDTSFLVATLTAAIQELKAELDATKAEVQALKGVA